jgi:UDP-N-acetylglucosamine--N-acetylmuramyl-(pentapeptide) pyrophosphoryl-undecaprenol N-acetylglucosamine transferase
MREVKKIAFTCGATGGHIYPVIAVAQELPDEQCVFIGSKRRKTPEIVNKYDYKAYGIEDRIKNPIYFFIAIIEAYRILAKERIKTVISSGGYTTVPVVIAAALKRIPIILLEQNVIPGEANKYLQVFAKKICISFEETKKQFRKSNCILTGNPVRKNYIEDDIFQEIKDALPKNGKTLLIFGGSQGSRSINALISQNKERITQEGYNTVHVTGKGGETESAGLNKSHIFYNDSGIHITIPYTEKMDALYDVADVVISRAGATTISEVLFYKKKAILIPFPFAKKNHQLANAIAFKKMGGGNYIEEKDLNIDTLINMTHKELEKTEPVLSYNKKNSAQAIIDML